MLNKIYFSFFLVAFPVFVFAENLTKTSGLLGSLKNIVTNILIPIAFTLALLFFFWGVAKYIWSEGQGKEDGRKIMIWGIVALFVMSSVWGIIYFIRGELGINDNSTVPIPTIGGSGSGSGGISGSGLCPAGQIEVSGNCVEQ